MDIELGVGIGKTLARGVIDDRYISYAWANAIAPQVTAISSVDKTVNAVISQLTQSALVPIITPVKSVNVLDMVATVTLTTASPVVSNASTVSILATITNTIENALVPVVSTNKNVSINSVIANTVISALVPSVSVGGGSTYYLQMDGVDDYIITPSFSFDEVIMDFSVNTPANFSKYIATNFWYIQHSSSGNETWDTNGWSTVYVNDIQVTSGTNFVPNDTRVTMRALRVNTNAYVTNLFRNTGSGGHAKGNLHSVIFKLSGTVVALYDMSTGTVQDQSGNGNHATLTGGTWVVA